MKSSVIHDSSKRDSNKSPDATSTSAKQALSAALSASFGFENTVEPLLAALNKPCALLAIRPLPSQQPLSSDVASVIAHRLPFRFLATIFEGTFVALASYAEIIEFFHDQEDSSWLQENSIVISQAIEEASAIPHQYRLVQFSFEKIGPDAGMHFAHDHALAFLVNEFSDNDFVESLLHPALRVLSDYDEKNRSELYRTLKTYLENDCSPQKSAERLFLHRNSLIYRIGKIEKLVSINLSNPQERSYLRLSFLLDS